MGKFKAFFSRKARVQALPIETDEHHAQRLERETYRPITPTRTVEDGHIRYDATADKIIMPGEQVSVEIGVMTPVPGTEWPGLPETAHTMFGVAEDFIAEKIFISPGFGLTGGFVGAQLIFPSMPFSNFIVPAEHLLSHDQPTYPTAQKGWVVTIMVKNISDRQKPCRVSVVGRDAAKLKAVA